MVPAHHGVGPDQQSEAVQHLAGQWRQQSGRQRSVLGSEPRPVRIEPAFKGGGPVAQGEDFHVLVVVAHRQ
ncbi:hypothetical protein [Streptomyces sp. NPDC050264]|uniref:hypothetical protein n=1 Tax=Streptomyces sp. NPDC050264 TaxID=3155038 RepID=UPI00343F0AE2